MTPKEDHPIIQAEMDRNNADNHHKQEISPIEGVILFIIAGLILFILMYLSFPEFAAWIQEWL